MNDYFAKFQSDLLTSVEQMKRGEPARVSRVEFSPVATARAHVGMSQREFAALLGGITPDPLRLGARAAASRPGPHADIA